MSSKLLRRVLTFLFAVLMLSTAALAQKQSAKYDPANELTLKKVVVQQIVAHDDSQHLIVRDANGTYEVCLCPAKFLTEMGSQFVAGDQLQITGSKAKMDDRDVILAREIVKGDDTLVLRDKQGVPVWTWLTK